MPVSLQKRFSLYSWLLKKLRSELIIWYFFTFVSSFFYYQSVFSLKRWGHESTKFPISFFFKTVAIRTRSGLLFYALFCFFIGSLLTNLICDYLKNYTLELCRAHLRKLLIRRSAKNPSKAHLNHQEILSNFWGETELFAPLFVLVPHRIYSAIVNTSLILIFLASFRDSDFAVSFVIIVSLILAFLSFFVYQIQKKINRQQDNFRQQENQAAEKYLENPSEPQKVEKLIDSNLQKSRFSLKKKTLSYLPNLIIPGLSVLFCFIFVAIRGTNWETTEFVDVGLIAGSIQMIFWKVKEITDNSLEISKIKVHHKSLQKVLHKLPEIEPKKRKKL
ncbi:Putative ABC transporter, trans-membrane domain [endosymbiont DhMRE of Dentiscutata heterogama]|uniref:hypothetical protein n=1 Tax=endosymbiont DhMRE of Dentiscutata heterogama TaxID=1609546 RepID=UPI000629DB30|nr:hypothetical protein [endosymbiont DhMRE of Dentiscutata heterogama]CFW92879.1 Putative ABC transporter, trans-membrane domain [endosymbiont DhMRE of Dentiscutata heterogama]